MGVRANGLGWAAREVAERARSIVRLELELAALEVKRKLGRIALGVGLGLGAVVLGVLALGFLLASAAAGISLALPVWAALLVVGGGLVAAAALLGLLAIRSFRRGTPPLPEAAIEEAKRATEALKANGR